MGISSIDPFLYFILMIVFGLIGFFRGFSKLRKKRAIENIPTSKIQSMAMGTVELCGAGRAFNELLTAPLTGTPCIYYKFQIEEQRGSGKHRHWVTIAKGDSQTCPFFLSDGTGCVLVSPQKAEMILPVDLNTHNPESSPHIKHFLQSKGLNHAGFFGLSHNRRFKEWHIRESETVYVLGFAQKDPQFEEKHSQYLYEKLSSLKTDKTALKHYDLNNDNEITQDEWTLVVNITEQALIEKYRNESQSREHYDTVIAYNPNSNIFIISDKSQKDLLKMLSLQIFLFIWGGGALAILGLWLALSQLNLL